MEDIYIYIYMRGLTPPSVVRQWGDALHECVCVCVLKLRLTLYTSNDMYTLDVIMPVAMFLLEVQGQT